MSHVYLIVIYLPTACFLRLTTTHTASMREPLLNRHVKVYLQLPGYTYTKSFLVYDRLRFMRKLSITVKYVGVSESL